MSQDISRTNAFTHGPLGPTLFKTALPVVFVMGMNGLLTVTDAVFLGLFAGPEALSSVTLMFPAYMLLVALATLVSNGMSSILARHLGGERICAAQAVFAGAHWLALSTGALVIALFWLFGRAITLAAANGSAGIADMSYAYLLITVCFSPLFFVLSVNADALRNEGRAPLMAGISLFVSVANIVFDYVLIGPLDFGVAGSAWATALAQMFAMALLLVFRKRGRTHLGFGALVRPPSARDWPRMLALGAPQSLSFIGIALGSTATFAMLQVTADGGYGTTVAAFGIVTRIMTFAYLPLLGLAQALQAMIGNNYGAKLWHRTDDTLRLGLTAAFLYCAGVQTALSLFAYPLGFLFAADSAVAGDVARILPTMVAMYFAMGPLFVVATYFQALGDARRAALLGLAKPYAFFLPLVAILPHLAGERGIWLASPLGEVLLLALTVAVLTVTARNAPARWGLFFAPRPG
ncbi:MATE family efflux transporter [Roseibium aggregatum]|uniref:Multidrug export protein MepA n=1 Tax=Roseibium aggregatum TaxID=187304 RepID=A0A939IYN8_9HYPH|nr:MATE family efflux transporter [Roseibium aggregatum]MBN9669176.1 MATE family efflux transporter [Roseibium aggregatum]